MSGEAQGMNRAAQEMNGEAQGMNRAAQETNGEAQGTNRAEQGMNREPQDRNGKAQEMDSKRRTGTGRRNQVAPEPGMKPTNPLYVAAWILLKIICAIVYPSTIEGREKLPRHKALLCPNHASNWDPLILATRLPVNYRLHAMAKKELFENPILGWILRHLGVFPVDRERADVKAVKTAMQTLRDGDNLLIFPEGTVIKDGLGYIDGLPAHAKSGAVMIGVRTEAVLIPVFMDGPKRPFHRCRIVIGDPYVPKITGRKGTQEEIQRAADEMLVQAYALGGQAVGGRPL